MADRRHPKTSKLPFSRLLSLLFLLCFVSVSLIINLSSSSSSPTPPRRTSETTPSGSNITAATKPTATAKCSILIDHAGVGSVQSQPLLCCDRAHHRTDVCYMSGDIRTSAASHRTILLHGAASPTANPEKIRPYPRKWEKGLMATVDELTLRPSPPSAAARCDVRNGVPGVVFSTGGYTGNVYHEFNDGLIPLYITAEMFAGEVVLVVAEYHDWWFEKYRRVLEKMSRYEVVNLRKDKRVHCFEEMIVGLRIHGELAVDSNLMRSGKGQKSHAPTSAVGRRESGRELRCRFRPFAALRCSLLRHSSTSWQRSTARWQRESFRLYPSTAYHGLISSRPTFHCFFFDACLPTAVLAAVRLLMEPLPRFSSLFPQDPPPIAHLSAASCSEVDIACKCFLRFSDAFSYSFSTATLG